MVHDAARPFVTAEVIGGLLSKRAEFECAFTATPVTDTIREFSGNIAGATVDRSQLVRVGTPQLFRHELLIRGFELVKTCTVPPTDEVMIVQTLGVPVGISWGDPRNFKITTIEDLEIAESLAKKK